MRTTIEYTTEQLSDAQIANMLRERKRRKRMIRRVTTRLGILFVALFLFLFCITTAVQHLLVKDTHAADTDPAEGQSIKGIVFIDPGHGGYDAGCEYKGRAEKDDMLTLGLAIQEELKARGYKAVMSRDTDKNLSRKKRAKAANQSGAGLMVSLHRSKGLNGQGFEAFVPSEDGERDHLLAKNILKELQSVGVSINKGVSPGMPQNPYGDYAENKYTNMPSTMVNFGYINNAEDNKLFDTHLKDYAAAVAKAVDDTYVSLYVAE